MKIIDKIRRKTEGLSNQEIAKEAALMVKSRLIHRYRHAKTIFGNNEITDDKLLRALKLPSSTDMLKHFQQRKEPLIFRGLREVALTMEIYGDYFPNSLEDTIRQ